MKSYVSFLIAVLAVGLLVFETAKADGPPIEWERAFSVPSSPSEIQQVSDGGYIVVGSFTLPSGDTDIYLTKADAEGNVQWQRTFSYAWNDRGSSVCQTHDGGYVIAGSTNPHPWYRDVYLIKTDPNGGPVWQETYGFDTRVESSISIQETNDGGYILVGWKQYDVSHDYSSSHCYVVKTRPNGMSEWTKTIGVSPDGDVGYDVIQNADGDYVIAGYWSIGSHSADASLVKLGATGQQFWKRAIGGSNSDFARSLRQTQDGGYIIVGATKSFGAGGHDIYLVRTDSNGIVLWEQTFGGEAYDEGRSVCQTDDGGFLVAGTIGSGGTSGNDGYLIRTAPDGSKLWDMTLGGSDEDSAIFVQQTYDNGFIVAGYTSASDETRVWIKKTAAEVVRLNHFEINQCFQEVADDGITQEYDLIETKPFVVRVKLERLNSGTTEVSLKLAVFKGAGEQIGISKKEDTIIGDESSGSIDFVFNDNETKNIVGGDYEFRLLVEDREQTPIFEKTLTYEFKDSQTIRMLVVPELRFKGEKGTWEDYYATFIENVFPVPKTHASNVNHFEIVRSSSLRKTIPSETVLSLELNALRLWHNARHLINVDFICGVVPRGSLKRAGGWKWGRAVVIEEGVNPRAVLAHEVGHVFGLGEEYVKTKKKLKSSSAPWVIDDFFAFDKNPPPLEFDNGGDYKIWRWFGFGCYDGKRCREVPDLNLHARFVEIDYDDHQPLQDIFGRPQSYMWCLGNYVTEGGYNVENEHEVPHPMSPVPYFSMMSSSDNPKWISGPEYQALIDRLVQGDSAKAQSLRVSTLADGYVRMMVSGTINVLEGTAEMSPLLPLQDISATPEIPDSNCSLVFLSTTEEVLGSFRFMPLESDISDSNGVGVFALVVDMPTDTAAVRLAIDGTVAAEVRVSDNSPTVEVLSPNGGELITDEMIVTWSSTSSRLKLWALS